MQSPTVKLHAWIGALGLILNLSVLTYSVCAAELSEKLKNWRPPTGAFLCRNEFPSKFDPADTEHCGDGDMTLFNGLLCLSGEELGCAALRQSKDGNGRWWRSPRRVGREYPNADVSFSPDQALGVLSYVLAKRDAIAFDGWLTWMDAHRGKLTSAQIREVVKPVIEKLHWPDWQINLATNAIANALPERITYCSDDHDARCTLRPGDCDIIKRVGVALGRKVDLCNGYLFFDQIETIFGSVGLELPNALSVASSYLNSDNYPLHLAAVQILLLQRMGERDDALVRAAATHLNEREARNAFFAFLAGKKTGPSGASELLSTECPATSDRSQWAWERPDSEKAWEKSMYWDCIFVARLLELN